MILSAIAAAASLSACTPVPGADQLWASPATRFVMVGETHGTNEAPEFFGDLVCAASEKRPVVVALEQDTGDQTAIDGFLASNGDSAARSAFVHRAMWTAFKDGRSSQAMFDLFDRLRLLKQAGRLQAVVAFRPPISQDPRPLLATPEGQRRLNDISNSGMAAQLEEIATKYPQALVLGYAGSVHVSRDVASNFGIRSAAARLPQAQTLTVFIDGEGFTWNMIGDEAGPHAMSSFTNLCRLGNRQVTFPPEEALPGFDAVACVGKPFTASPPAVPAGGK